jgi:peptidoglycan hydrolase-like protein with peptidoglycan-binding domain
MTKFFNILLAAAALAATPASAAVVTGKMDLDNGIYVYDLTEFTVTVAGDYSMLLESQGDNFLYVFRDSYDLYDWDTDNIGVSDDISGLNAGFDAISFTPGVQYFAINSNWNGNKLNYKLTITGPGDVNVNGSTGAVPEPASWAMLIAGFGLTGAAARRRRTAAAIA